MWWWLWGVTKPFAGLRKLAKTSDKSYTGNAFAAGQRPKVNAAQS
jgi:hypothetical protein